MNYYYKLTIAISISIYSFYCTGQNPTGYLTGIQLICDSDGVFAATVTSGMTPPLEFTYFTNLGVTTHSNVNSLSDTIFNLNAYLSLVKVTDGFNNDLFLSHGASQFANHIQNTIIRPSCPDSMATIEFTGYVYPLTLIEWYNGSYPGGQYLGSGNPFDVSVYSDFTCYITDSNGCKHTYTNDSIYGFHALSPMNAYLSSTIASCTNGTATIDSISGGTPPYYYQWANGQNGTTINNLSKGKYYVTITDSNHCTGVFYKNVSQSPNINVNSNITHVTCLNNNGSIYAFASNGISPYVYSWSNGSNSNQISNLIPGKYTVIATDANGCVGSGSFFVTVTTPITCSVYSVNSSCTAPTGSMTLTISNGTPPYTVVWDTSPVQTGNTATNLSVGYYNFSVTDSVGCSFAGKSYLNGESYLFAALSASDILCPFHSGLIEANVQGNAPPFSVNWSNGNTGNTCHVTQPGIYYCTLTDYLGCSKTLCSEINITSNINISFTTIPASCKYLSDGSITANITGGTPPYVYTWMPTGGNNQTASGLLTGYYSCYITDANGCVKSKSIFLDYNHNNNSCYCTITGKVFVDANSNCAYDPGENLVQNIMMHCQGYGYTFTNSAGEYSFMVPSGTYSIREIIQNTYPLSPCQANPVETTVTAFPGCTNVINFAQRVDPLHDIRIYSTSANSPPVPGYSFNQVFIIKNAGTLSEPDIVFGHNDNGQIQENSITPSIMANPSVVSDPDWYRNHSGTISLDPGESKTILFSYNVPPNVPLGAFFYLHDTVSYSLPITNWLNDYSPWNNRFDTTLVVVGSYDPNFKEVYPAGYAPQGFIKQTDSVLTYTIHFQNTGTYFAQNIYITDTISSNLDISTMEILFASHNCNVSVSESGVICFTFSNINLPFTDWYGELLSSGFVTYTIKTKPNLLPGTVIENGAAIFFDFNEPVITNKVVNTIEWPASVFGGKVPTVSVFPNPTDNAINIQSPVPISGVIIFDCLGRPVYETTFSEKQKLVTLPVSHLAPGLYMAGCRTLDYRIDYVRFIKE